MRRRTVRGTVGGIALMLLGSCTTMPDRTVPDHPGVQPVPPSVRVDRPTPQPRRTPGPATFSYSGPRMQGGAVIGIAPSGTSVLTFNGVPVPVSGDGRFLIAFDRDAPPSATLVATLEDGRQVSDALVVAPRAWLIERLNTLPKFPRPQPEMERLRPAEVAQINAARRVRSDSQGWRQVFLWPTTGRISGMFGSQRVYQGQPGAYHSGTDIARPAGTPVLAPADGVVILAADHPFTLEGNLLMIDHGMELNSAFLHLSRIDVHVGERVRRGQTIGAVGMSGRATGPHLHWSLKWRDSRIDPLLLAGPMPTAR
ncbi:M23 family metallopeptidase [Sphingomonas sp. UYAg733]